MPRRPGMREDDVMARLHDAERRLDDLEERAEHRLPKASAAVKSEKVSNKE
mgnify:CR=1 FL=1